MSSCVFVFFPSFFCERLFSILCFLSSLRLFSVLPRWFPDPVFWMCFSLHASRRPGLDFVKILLLLLVPRLCYLDFTFSFVKAHILLRFPACLCVFHLQTYRMLVMKTMTYISYILLFDTKLGMRNARLCDWKETFLIWQRKRYISSPPDVFCASSKRRKKMRNTAEETMGG